MAKTIHAYRKNDSYIKMCEIFIKAGYALEQAQLDNFYLTKIGNACESADANNLYISLDEDVKKQIVRLFFYDNE